MEYQKVSSRQVAMISNHMAALTRVEDILFRLRHGYLNAELRGSEDGAEKVHLHSSPWAKFGMLMHYTLRQHTLVMELRHMGIPEDDDRVQPCQAPDAPR